MEDNSADWANVPCAYVLGTKPDTPRTHEFDSNTMVGMNRLYTSHYCVRCGLSKITSVPHVPEADVV